MVDNTLPDGWRKVMFGDAVRQVKDRVDPGTAGIERYVAGDHMDSDELRIRRWGKVGDGYLGPAFHMRFRPGHVLYGSRRTYLRKVACPDFEGICANTTFVLESAVDDLLPEFLPLVMTAEDFHAHSIEQSKGSVNPYINFKDLTWYEFGLPPVDEQRAIVRDLAIAQAVVDRLDESMSAAENLGAAVVDSAIWNAGAWAVPLSRVGDLLTESPRNGVSPRASSSASAMRTVSISAIRDGRLVVDSNTIKECEAVDNSSRFEIRAGDAFAVRGNGNRDLVGRLGFAAEQPSPPCLYPDLLIRLRFDPALLDPQLATAIWNNPRVHRRLLDRAKSSNGIYKVNGKDIASHLLPVPALSDQKWLNAQLRAADRVARAARQHCESSVVMRRSLQAALLRGQRNV